MNDPLADAIRGRTEAMLELIRELVLVNSHTKNRAGGMRVGEIFAREATALGLRTRRIASEIYADHLVVETELGAASSRGAVALVGHLDTVFPEGTFEGYRCEDGIARGPGVLDMKGGLVVALEALRALRAAGTLARLPLRFVIVSEEEIGSPEGRPILQAELPGAACALVFEAGRAEDKIITSRKGTGSAKVLARGRAAHAANGHKEGKNAIWAMAKFVDGAQSLTDYARGITVNVGLIRGGEAKNTVPDHCEVELDFRFQTIADADATFARMKEIAASASAAVEGTSIEVSGGPARYPLERTPENVALYQVYAACAKEAGLGSAEAPLIAGGSDASSTSAIGIPSIDGLGPRGSGFHTKEELIETASLEPKALALARFLALHLQDGGAAATHA
ncbi:MAG: M20 family metallopeptidase [Polyangiaceae bacterium]